MGNLVSDRSLLCPLFMSHLGRQGGSDCRKSSRNHQQEPTPWVMAKSPTKPIPRSVLYAKHRRERKVLEVVG
jgi:hypothetical protein